jgi:hypothetical protein
VDPDDLAVPEPPEVAEPEGKVETAARAAARRPDRRDVSPESISSSTSKSSNASKKPSIRRSFISAFPR